MSNLSNQSEGTEARTWRYGAFLSEAGVEYLGWFPEDDHVEVCVFKDGDEPRILRSEKLPGGYHRAFDPDGAPSDRYVFRKPDGREFQDPASHAVTDVHGKSIVVDHARFQWSDDAWQRPVFRDLVIYELHIGTFTPEGTYKAACAKLPHLKSLGINAIEIMPLGQCPGTRNWGYDGVFIYAPAKEYGSADDLRTLINEAHTLGIAVLLDVVYNHFGPDGNYLAFYSRHFFSTKHETPWGEGFNFDGEHPEPVRTFFLDNLHYWMRFFHMDGFRLDATHTIEDNSTPHILAEMAAQVKATGRYILAEDERNDATMLNPKGEGGYDFDAVWADDFHHSVRVSQTGDRNAYFADYVGSSDELSDILHHGWLFRGQQSAVKSQNRGTPCAHLPPSKFLHCISNHDQVGNRAMGDRPTKFVSLESYRAASMLICLTPYTPMLFMGQEWGSSTPFLFFTDHGEELGKAVTEGRRKEFASFPEFSHPEALQKVPDPQDISTYHRSKLNWDEREEETQRGILALYKKCLALRNTHQAFRPLNRDTWRCSSSHEMVAICLEDEEHTFLLVVNLSRHKSGNLHEHLLTETIAPRPGKWEILFSSNDPTFGGSGCRMDAETLGFNFETPEVVLLQLQPS